MPEAGHFARSGKIMRRILRKIAENQADPHVVESLVKGKQ